MKKVIIFLFVFCFKQIDAQQFQWANGFGSVGLSTIGTSLTHDNAGNLIVTGSFAGTIDFDPGISIYAMTSNGPSDLFLAKYDANGNFLSAFQLPSGVFAYQVICDQSNNIILAGNLSDTTDINPSGTINNLTPIGTNDIFVAKYDPNGNYLWAFNLGCSNEDGRAKSLSCDLSGDILISGYFGGTTDFNPGIGTYNLTVSTAGYENIFVAKYDQSGNFSWALSYSGKELLGSAESHITTDLSKNIIVTGAFRGTVDYDPGTGTNNITALNRDIFLAKYSPTGNYLWAFNLGHVNKVNSAYCVTTDNNNNVVIGGGFDDTLDFNPGTGINNLIGNSAGTFLAKYNPNGNYIWALSFSGNASINNIGNPLAIDQTGNILISGSLNWLTDFNPSSALDTVRPTGNNSNSFFAKYDLNGNYVWAVNIEVYSLAVNILSNGDFYSTGFLQGFNNDLDPSNNAYYLNSHGGSGNTDLYVARYSSSLNSLNEIASNNSLHIFPNPTNSILQIASPKDVKLSDIQITDVLGNSILNLGQTDSIDVSFLSNGIYFISVELDKTIYKQKFIISK